MIVMPTIEEDQPKNQKSNIVEILVEILNYPHGLKNSVNLLLNLHKPNFLITLLFLQSY